jgi:hypothetical protein
LVNDDPTVHLVLHDSKRENVPFPTSI